MEALLPSVHQEQTVQSDVTGKNTHFTCNQKEK